MRTLLLVASMLGSATSAAQSCKLTDGNPVELTGLLIARSNFAPDGSTSKSPVLVIEKPICVRSEPMDEAVGQAKDEQVNEFQLVSYAGDAEKTNALISNHINSSVKVKGILSSQNFTQYYVVPHAIDVESIAKAKSD